MRQLLRLNAISPLVNDVIKGKYELLEKAESPLGIMVRSFVMHEYILPESTLCVGRAGAGVNNIPLDKYAEKGVVVFNTPGANANAVKELCVLALLMCGRKVYPSLNWAAKLTDGETKVEAQVEKGKANFGGTEITGKVLAVYGLGAIGMMVAEAAYALGMNVIGYDPFLSKEAEEKMNKGIKRVNSIDELTANCDYITLHVPLTDETRGFICNDRLAKMKKGVNIINCARGELVVDDDVILAAQDGKVNRYVTDFPNAKLLNKENIICIPHLGASTEEAEDNCAVMAANQMVDYIENGNIKNSVNFPAVCLEKNGEGRMVILFCDCAKDEILAKIGKMSKVIDYKCEVKKGKGVIIANLSAEICNCKTDLEAIKGVYRVHMPK